MRDLWNEVFFNVSKNKNLFTKNYSLIFQERFFNFTHKLLLLKHEVNSFSFVFSDAALVAKRLRISAETLRAKELRGRKTTLRESAEAESNRFQNHRISGRYRRASKTVGRSHPLL